MSTPKLKPDSPEISQFVERASKELGGVPLPVPKDVCAFGDSPELQDELLALVLAGTKRATADWPIQDPLPWGVGDISVALDGKGLPAAIFRTIELVPTRFRDVDAQFAFDEGEGDKSLGWWRDAHTKYFLRQDPSFTDDAIVLCERFELVYPPISAVTNS